LPSPPPDLPLETLATYEGYLRQAHLTRELLIAKVRRYLDTLCEAREDEQRLDVETSSDLGRGLLRLLRECADQHLPQAQAAALYFVESQDAEPDLASATGFDDDARVFNCVCRHVGLPELQVRE
jgi:hypothetical protein